MNISTFVWNKVNGLREIWHFSNRWQLIMVRALFPYESINIYRINGLQILVDHSAGDVNGSREILISPMYGQYLKKMKLTGPLRVLDFGANIGCFPLLLKLESFNVEKLACVELNPRTFMRMRFNVERNLDCKIIPLNVALVGESREIELCLGEGGTSDHIYTKNSSRNGKAVIVKGRTFDDIFHDAFGEEVIDICKIDVEGAEYEVFKSNNYKHLKKCRYILIEVHHEAGKPREEVLRKISESGFLEIDGESKRRSDRHYVHFFANKHLGA